MQCGAICLRSIKALYAVLNPKSRKMSGSDETFCPMPFLMEIICIKQTITTKKKVTDIFIWNIKIWRFGMIAMRQLSLSDSKWKEVNKM